MGWTFGNDRSVHALIQDLTVSPYMDSRNNMIQCLKHYYVASASDTGTLYIAKQKISPDGVVLRRFINVFLLEFSGIHGSWGYKPMQCCMGPYADTCPPDILDLCPPHNNEWCKEFHARCRAAHGTRISAHIIGTTKDGRLIGTCKDAFTVSQWWE